MAGSWQHATTKDGKLLSNERFIGSIENLGDAYEMAEEMYGMIWWLASMLEADENPPREQILETIKMAMYNHLDGLEQGGVEVP